MSADILMHPIHGMRPEVADFQGVIFDFDGVLIDSEDIAHTAWIAAMGEMGERVGKARLMDAGNGMTNDAMLAWLQSEYGWTPPAGFHDDLSARFVAAFDATALIDGARETLELLRARGVPIALATNSGHEEMLFKLDAVDLAGVFGELAFDPSHVGGRAKPAPDLYAHAARMLRLAPAECLVIEDSAIGTRAAVAAGCTVWGINVAHHSAQQERDVLQAGAARMVGSHAELQQLLGLV